MIIAIGAGNIGVVFSREEQFEEYARSNSSLVSFFRAHSEDENLEIVRYFISQGKIDYLHQANEDDVRPLVSILFTGQLELAELLLEHGASPNVNIGSNSLLQLAAFLGKSECVQILLRYGVDVNYQNPKDGATALFAAAQMGRTEIAKLLLDQGALFTKTFQGASPLAMACQAGQLGVVEHLVRAGVDINEICLMNTPIVTAAQNGHFEIVKFLLATGADINLTGRGYTALHAACEYGHESIASYLLDHGADRNISFIKYGVSALYIAAQNDHFSIVKIFFAKKELLSGSTLKSVLAIAVEKGHIEISLFLLEQGLDINQLDIAGDATPLMLASYKGHLEIVQQLLERGATVDVCSTKNGANALHLAAQEGYVDIVRLLLEHKADPNMINAVTKYTPLMKAFDSNFLPIMQLLLSFGANINYEHPEWSTLLDWYAAKQDPIKVSLLLRLGADVSVFNKHGSTPFHTACIIGSVEIVKLFLDKGVDVCFPTKKKLLPISFACGEGHVEIVEILWARGSTMEWWQLVMLLDRHSSKLTVGDAEKWFDRLFDVHRDPNLIIKKIFQFPLPLISVLHLKAQSGSSSEHYAALYRRLLTKEGLIIPEALVTKVERSLVLEDIDGEIRESLRLMSLWGKYSNNPWGLPLEEVERIKSVKEYCKTSRIKEEFAEHYHRLITIYDLWVTRHPLLSFLRLASRNFREIRLDEPLTIKPPICIVASLFNQYQLASTGEVQGYLRESAPNRKRVWKILRNQIIRRALQISFPEDLTFIHGTTTSTLPGLKKSRALLPLGMLMDRGEVAFAGELCGSHSNINKYHISGITLPSSGSTLQSQYYNLTTGVHVAEFYAIGGAAERYQQGLFALEEAFSHITSALLDGLDQERTDFLLIHIKRIKQFGHGDDPRMMDLLARTSALPLNIFLCQIVRAIKDMSATLTPEEKLFIERRAPIVFASSSPRPEVRPHKFLESFEYHSLPIKKIEYAFTNPDQIPFLQEALKETGIKVDSLETLRTLSLFCMARGTWVENRISELTPIIGGAQAEITAILEGYILPNYTKPFPEKPSYVDELGIRRELASPYFGDGITSHAEYMAQVNLQAILPRNIHGLMHAVRVAIAAQMINNLLGYSPLEAWAIAACADHDEGRGDEGEDRWDRKSGDHFSSTMFIATQGSQKAVIYGAAIANKDTTDLSLKTRLVEILHDADVLEMHRIFPSHPEKFDKTYLYFLTNGRIEITDREAINAEWREFVRLTEDPELKFRLEFQVRSYYLEVMQLLAKCVSEGRFPTIGRFLDKELKAIEAF